ncbi:hypothetical protein B9Z55_027921 [Caenorhabditis nigoni]|uniref:Uncharacterized protein n=1 Tax=Caenorhabditis nigoni TaxID=1611254 RepID=A0A2G5SE07_9PELO|nr:hypothetical protein B9Z55_027921 [Caenorhabditis nigoni]
MQVLKDTLSPVFFPTTQPSFLCEPPLFRVPGSTRHGKPKRNAQISAQISIREKEKCGWGALLSRCDEVKEERQKNVKRRISFSGVEFYQLGLLNLVTDGTMCVPDVIGFYFSRN